MKIPTLLFLIFVLSSVGISTCNKESNQALKVLEENRNNWFYRDALLEYFNNKSAFPADLSKLFIYTDELSKDIKYQFIDPFSPESELLKYIPVVNEKSKTIGFVLLSRGPDNEINNKYDQLTIPDIEKLVLYNSNDSPFYHYSYEIETEPLCKLNLFDRISGQKDIGIIQFFGEEYYESEAKLKGKITLNNLIEIQLNNIIRYGIYHYQLAKNFIIDSDDNNVILISNIEGYKILSKIPKCRYNDTIFKENRSYNLIGYLGYFSTEEKIIKIENCFLSEYDQNN